MEHVEGDMFENIPEGHAIFMKVSFISERHYVTLDINPNTLQTDLLRIGNAFLSYLIVSIIPHPIDLVMAQNIIRNWLFIR